MDTFSLAFTGGAWWVYALIVAAAIGLAFVTYRNTIPDPGRSRRLVLVALRSVALAALLLALFEPVIRVVRSEVVRPRVALLVDRSMSAGMRDGSGERLGALRAAVKRVVDRFSDNVDIGLFDGGVEYATRPWNPDTLQTTGRRTDIAAALRWASNSAEARGTQAIVLVSDGNANSGDDPVSIAERSGIPVVTIGIGDTVPPKDAVLTSMLLPSIAHVGEETSLSVDVATNGLINTTVDVVLEEDGREISRQRVDVRDHRMATTLTMAYKPTAEGVRKLTSRIVQVDGEFSSKNNATTDFITVRSNKRGVVIVAGAPSPDLAFFTDVLASDPTIRLTTFVQRQGGAFYGPPPTQASFKDAVAIMLVGFPVASTPPEVVAAVSEAIRGGRSMLFVTSADVDYSKLGGLAELLPFKVVASRPREFPVTADVSPTAAADPIMRVRGGASDGEIWNDLPPIYRTETFVDVHPQATILATQRLNGVPMGDPLIISRDAGDRRTIAILGHGLYRWKLLGRGPGDARGADGVDVLSAMVDNAVRWLSANDEHRRVRIRPSRMTYASGEVVQFLGTVLDATDAPVDQADVRVTILGGGRSRDLFLAPLGNGRFGGVAGVLPPGDYTYRASARTTSTQIGTDEGRFSVGDVNVEYLGTTMNATLLRHLADATNGHFAHVSELDIALDKLIQDPRFIARTLTTDRDIALWSAWWLLAIAIAAFGTEWFLRKRSGLV